MKLLRAHKLQLSILLTALFTTALFAQPQKPPPNPVKGTLTNKGPNMVEVKTDDGQLVSLAIVPPGMKVDPAIQGYIDGMAIGTAVRISWGVNSNTRWIRKFDVVPPPTPAGDKAGAAQLGQPNPNPDAANPQGSAANPNAPASDLLVGTVTGMNVKKKPFWIEIKDDAGNAQQYWPRYLEEGFDPDIVKAIADRNVGDRVEIRIGKDEHIRVITMRLLSMPPAPTTKPGGDAGSITGKVIEKGADWLTIQASDGTRERYTPQRIAGALGEVDKEILKVMQSIAVGTDVEAQYFRDGNRRLFALKPAVGAIVPTPDGH